MLDIALSSAKTSAANGGLSKYELQILAESYPDLIHVFGLIDQLQDDAEDVEDKAEAMATEEHRELRRVVTRIEGHRTDLAGHLDNLDFAIQDETDIDLDGFREALAEARNSMSAIETECDNAPE